MFCCCIILVSHLLTKPTVCTFLPLKKAMTRTPRKQQHSHIGYATEKGLTVAKAHAKTVRAHERAQQARERGTSRAVLCLRMICKKSSCRQQWGCELIVFDFDDLVISLVVM